VVCLCRGAFQLVFAGRFERADPLLARIAELAGDLDALEPGVAAQVHHVRGVRAAHAGHVGDFKEHLERALASFEQAGDTRNVALERPTLGWCYAELGELERAEATLRTAVETCERLGVMQTKTYALVNLAFVLALRGSVAEARTVQTAAAESCRAQGNPRLEGWSRTHLSTLELGEGDLAAAEAQAETAVSLLTASPGLRAWAEAALARAKLRGGDTEGALALSARAYATLRSLGSILQCESLVPLVRAESLAAAGHEAERADVLAYARTRLLERADRLAPSLRERFLSLPDNVATLSAASRCLGSG
jgi:ATP/maltotriose-dependent transcriptional regulator MalT